MTATTRLYRRYISYYNYTLYGNWKVRADRRKVVMDEVAHDVLCTDTSSVTDTALVVGS